MSLRTKNNTDILINQQVVPQAAKALSPQFPSMGGYGGGSSNSFGQMPTGAAPTSTSGTGYSQMNPRASVNTNGYGRLFGCSTALNWCIFSRHCSVSDASQSAAQFPSRAAEAVWPQWQGQQHSQNNTQQHPHAQGNQQDMFPVSDTSSISAHSGFFVFSLSIRFFVCVVGCFVYAGPAYQLQQRWLWASHLLCI